MCTMSANPDIMRQIRLASDTYVLLVSAFPRICIRVLSSGVAVAFDSYTPRTKRAESSSLSWSSFDEKRAE